MRNDSRVCPECDRHLVRNRKANRLPHRCSRGERLLGTQAFQHATRGKPLDGFTCHECWNQVRAVSRHEPRTFSVEERAMLDRRNSGARRDLDAFGTVRVGSHAALMLAGFVNHRLHFFEVVLSRSDSIPLG